MSTIAQRTLSPPPGLPLSAKRYSEIATCTMYDRNCRISASDKQCSSGCRTLRALWCGGPNEAEVAWFLPSRCDSVFGHALIALPRVSMHILIEVRWTDGFFQAIR